MKDEAPSADADPPISPPKPAQSSGEGSKSDAVDSESKEEEEKQIGSRTDVGAMDDALPKSADASTADGRKSTSPPPSPLMVATVTYSNIDNTAQTTNANPSNPAAPPQQQASKKRKPNPVLLADSHVVQITHDVLGLLQLYGPLTKAQMEYNLPPCRRSLQDILELLVAAGVVRVVDTGIVSSELLYSVFTTTRHDVILPQQVLPALESAHAEFLASLERGQILKDYLKNYSPSSPAPAALLQKLLMEFPDIRNDPVYMAAMRNVGVVDALDSAGKSK